MTVNRFKQFSKLELTVLSEALDVHFEETLKADEYTARDELFAAEELRGEVDFELESRSD